MTAVSSSRHCSIARIERDLGAVLCDYSTKHEQHMPEVDLAAARQRFDQPPRTLATTE